MWLRQILVTLANKYFYVVATNTGDTCWQILPNLFWKIKKKERGSIDFKGCYVYHLFSASHLSLAINHSSLLLNKQFFLENICHSQKSTAESGNNDEYQVFQVSAWMSKFRNFEIKIFPQLCSESGMGGSDKISLEIE